MKILFEKEFSCDYDDILEGHYAPCTPDYFKKIVILSKNNIILACSNNSTIFLNSITDIKYSYIATQGLGYKNRKIKC